ncbi:MAG: hypothetical protein ACTSU5_16990 [Promethearchaeota archaeon]
MRGKLPEQPDPNHEETFFEDLVGYLDQCRFRDALYHISQFLSGLEDPTHVRRNVDVLLSNSLIREDGVDLHALPADKRDYYVSQLTEFFLSLS